ncbi:MAG: sigma-70 family RNA polymerase sigma factor [Bacteroidia bacterium]
MSENESSDEELMLKSGTGNRLAFELLYERYYERLIKFALRFDMEIHNAEDTVQEVFMKLIQHPERFDANKKFGTWIYTLTANACKNKRIQDSNRERIISEQIRPFVSTHSSNKESLDYKRMQLALQKGINTLNEKEKQIYSLRFEYELALKDIAALLQIPEGTVRSTLFYLLKKLSHHLKAYKNGNK